MTGVDRRSWAFGSLYGIVDALAGIEATADYSTRTRLMSLIETQGGEFRVERSNERRSDLIAIVQAALLRPDGASMLRSASNLIFGGDAQDAATVLRLCDLAIGREPSMLDPASRAALVDELYGIALPAEHDVQALFARATEPIPVQTSAATLNQAILQLERQSTGVHLFRFLELVAAYSTDTAAGNGLRGWVDAHMALVLEERQAEITDLRASLAGRLNDAEVRTVLLVRVEPIEDELFNVAAWLGQTDGLPGPNCGPEDVVTLPQVKAWISDLIRQYRNGALDPGRHPLIDVLLPSSHFGLDVDAWLVDGVRLGALYQVSVRPMTPSATRADLLKDRWTTLVAGANGGQTAQTSARWLASTAPPLDEAPPDPTWSWIAITCPLMTTTAAGVDAVLDTGAPVAAWLRGDLPGPARREVLDTLSRGRLVTELPRAIHKARELAWKNGTGRRDLVLLWDDPTRPPPQDHQVSAPQARK